MQMDCTGATEKRISQRVSERACIIGGKYRLEFEEPLAAGKRLRGYAQPDVASVSRQIKREFGKVSAIHAKGYVRPVKWPAEEFLSVADDNRSILRRIAKRSRNVFVEQRRIVPSCDLWRTPLRLRSRLLAKQHTCWRSRERRGGGCRFEETSSSPHDHV